MSAWRCQWWSAENPRGRGLGGRARLCGARRSMPHMDGIQHPLEGRHAARGLARTRVSGQGDTRLMGDARLGRPKVGISSPMSGVRVGIVRPSQPGPGRCRSLNRHQPRGRDQEATSGPPQSLRDPVTGVHSCNVEDVLTVWAPRRQLSIGPVAQPTALASTHAGHDCRLTQS